MKLTNRIYNVIWALFVVAGGIVRLTPDCGSTEIKREFYLKMARDASLPLKQRIAYYDSITRTRSGACDYNIWQEKAGLQKKSYDYDGADASLVKSAEYIPADSVETRCMALLETADVRQMAYRYREAAATILEVLKTEKPDSLMFIDAMSYVIIAELYERLENRPKEKWYLDRAESIIRKLPPTTPVDKARELNLIYNACRGNYHYLMHDWDKALKSWKKAMTFTTDPTDLGQLNAFIGLLFHHLGDYDTAIRYNLEFLEKFGDGYNGSVGAQNYVRTLMYAGRLVEAQRALSTYSDKLARLKDHDRETLEQLMGEIAHRSGNDSEAYRHLLRAFDIKDSLSVVERSVYTSSLDEDIVAWEAQQAEAARERSHSLMFWLTWLLAAIVIIGGVVILIFAQRNKRHKRHSAELDEHITALTETWARERNESEQSMKMSNKELSDMSMHMGRLSDAISEIRSLTSRRTHTSGENLAEIKQVVRRLSVQDNAWEMFKVYFEKSNLGFFNRLYKLHPDLTNAEKRMCAFQLMGMTTKEIAQLTNRSPKTVHCIKNNLRHKLGITEPTESYLRRISIEAGDTPNNTDPDD